MTWINIEFIIIEADNKSPIPNVAITLAGPHMSTAIPVGKTAKGKVPISS